MGKARNLMVSTDAIDADDLPDIVDVVMEMGRPDEGPSPPPPVTVVPVRTSMFDVAMTSCTR